MIYYEINDPQTTELFTVLEAGKLSIDISELHKDQQFPDFGVLSPLNVVAADLPDRPFHNLRASKTLDRSFGAS